MPVVESLFTIPEASKLARVSARTYWKLIAAAKAPEVVRIGRSVRIRASDLDLWLRLGCPNRERFEAAKSERQGDVQRSPNRTEGLGQFDKAKL